MNNRRRLGYSNHSSTSDFSKKIKDYIVPIIAWILILFLIWTFFFKTNSSEKTNLENRIWMSITKDIDSKAIISFKWWKDEELKEWVKLFRWEKIIVSNWRILLSDENISLNLNKLSELKYLENWNFSFDSWEAWIDAVASTNLDMKFVKLKISADSHISISQNEINSTVYVISWKVEVSNLAWKNTVLWSNEKIEVSRAEASDSKIDLSIKKEPLNDYFLKSDWFTINNWSKYFWTWIVEETKTWTWETNTWTTSNTWKINSASNFTWKSKYITISNLLDESNVSSSVISVWWAYDTEVVSKIEINWKVATLNSKTGTFKVENISVPLKENDVVFKIFNADEELIEKFVYTVYYDWATTKKVTAVTETTTNNTFWVDWTKFVFTAPISWTTYTTYEDFVTIKWSVSASWIDKVTVNDFKLSSFNGSTWKYHANKDYWNLVSWTNIYEIKYFSWTKMVYKNFYIIIKKDWVPNYWNNTNNSISNTTNNSSSNSNNTNIQSNLDSDKTNNQNSNSSVSPKNQETTEKNSETTWTWKWKLEFFLVFIF